MIAPISSPIRLMAPLLFFSGGCALVYQMVWLKEFRLIFGAATPAAATVLAVFMGGLGAGSLWFGRKAERTPHPLRWYAGLELSLSVGAALTPLLLQTVRGLYIQTGGVVALGPGLAGMLQVLLTFVVLGGPCFLMGGTLPMAVKWVETDADRGRGSAGLLYGLNALGALLGVVVSTFWLLETVGTHGTLYLAAGLNCGIGLVAWGVDRKRLEGQAKGVPGPAIPSFVREPSFGIQRWVYGAAFVTGFVFFLIELVWYRMSAPLLGGSTYNLGIVLAVALAGIGVGGVVYRVAIAPRTERCTPALFGAISALQAFFLVLPYGLGDRVAILAFHANQLRGFGFGGQVLGWGMTASLLGFLPSVFAGIQFPLLLSLLGQGREGVGRQMGTAYAWNTGGAILGSLLGGFILIPTLSAPGCWKLAVWMTLAVSVIALGKGLFQPPRTTRWAGLILGTGALWISLAALGPTAVWRHSAIGYGRVDSLPESQPLLRAWMNHQRWRVRHEFDGRESSLAISSQEDCAFYVNGKSDGSALGDVGTQVMGGLVGAVLHPSPRRACVVGLGTGSSAGWLADVPGMEQVDVIEIEPGMRDLARDYFSAVNRDVVRKPNVRIIPGDAREVLLVQGPTYDLIFSEPSNPNRAGIASLYTREYYEAVRRRLGSGGIFSQWVQGYEVDTETVRLVYATLSAVFPHVETWVTKPNDLLFVCHLQTPAYSLDQLRNRLKTPPFDEALRRAWMTDSVEGFLAHHIASPAIAREVARQVRQPNTDDRNRMEYGFARALVSEQGFGVGDILRAAIQTREDRPTHVRDDLDPGRLGEERLFMLVAANDPIQVPPQLEGEARSRAEAIEAYVQGDFERVLKSWRGSTRGPMAQLILLEALAQRGQRDQLDLILERMRDHWATEVGFAQARAAARHGSVTAAVQYLQDAFIRMRTDPWVRPRVVREALLLAQQLGTQSPQHRARLFEAIAQPFSATASEISRLESMSSLAQGLPIEPQLRAVAAWGRWPPWNRAFLEFRRDAYAQARDPRLAEAQADLDTFLAQSGRTFLESMAPSAR